MSALVARNESYELELKRNSPVFSSFAQECGTRSIAGRLRSSQRAQRLQRAISARGHSLIRKHLALIISRSLNLDKERYSTIVALVASTEALTTLAIFCIDAEANHRDIYYIAGSANDPLIESELVYEIVGCKWTIPWALSRMCQTALPQSLTFPLPAQPSLQTWLHIGDEIPHNCDPNLLLPFREEQPMTVSAPTGLLSRIYPLPHTAQHFPEYVASVKNQSTNRLTFFKTIYREYILSPYYVFDLPILDPSLENNNGYYRSILTRDNLAWVGDTCLRVLTDQAVDHVFGEESADGANIKSIFGENRGFHCLLDGGGYEVYGDVDIHTKGTHVEAYVQMFLEARLTLKDGEAQVEQWVKDNIVKFTLQLKAASDEYRKLDVSTSSRLPTIPASRNQDTTSLGSVANDSSSISATDLPAPNDVKSCVDARDSSSVFGSESDDEAPSLITDSDSSPDSSLSESEKLEDGEIEDDFVSPDALEDGEVVDVGPSPGRKASGACQKNPLALL